MAKRAEGSGRAVGRSQAVHRALKRAILEQALPPGTKLPEDSIGERMGVSRTLVREALVRLGEEGLVEHRPNRGASVAQPSLEDGLHLFRIRGALELLVVESLCGQLGEEQVEALKAHIAMENAAAKEGDAPRSIRLAGEFHVLLAEMTGNATLIRFVNEVVVRSSLILSLYGRPHSSDCAVTEHREVLDALVAGDRSRAMSLMDSHLHAITSRALIREEPEKDAMDVLLRFAAEEGLA